MPADGVGLANRAAQALRDLLQHVVADGMSERVVDLLEFVQIQEQQGQAGSVALGHGDGLGKAVQQQHAVGQLRQRVDLTGPDRFGQLLGYRLCFSLVAQGRHHQLLVGLQDLRRLAVAQAALGHHHVLQQAQQHGSRRLDLALHAGEITFGLRGAPRGRGGGGAAFRVRVFAHGGGWGAGPLNRAVPRRRAGAGRPCASADRRAGPPHPAA